jgi:hypothetical protein
VTTAMVDLREVITAAARGAGRSQQVAIGPSEIGWPATAGWPWACSGHPSPTRTATSGRPRSAPPATRGWRRPSAGQRAPDQEGHAPRWLIEQTVEIRTGLDGHCDLYDLETHTVIDHKFPGVTSIRKYRKQGHPGQQYRWQAHLYGMGWANAGLPVENVMLVMWPRSGLLTDAWSWSEPYSPAVADEAWRGSTGC